jgi:signal transduction histidine kinase
LVGIALERWGEKVHLEVRDFGRGFDPSAISGSGGPGERVGLSSMRQRIALLGGDFEIRSRQGEGTTVVAEVLLPKPDGGGTGHAG